MIIEPATFEQVRLGKTGRVHVFSARESQVAADLARLAEAASTRFLLRWHEETGHFSVVQKYGPRDDQEQLVATAMNKEALPLVVQEIERMVNREYDLPGQLDEIEAERQKRLDDEAAERIGDRSERLLSRVRRDTGATDRIVVPRSV